MSVSGKDPGELTVPRPREHVVGADERRSRSTATSALGAPEDARAGMAVDAEVEQHERQRLAVGDRTPHRAAEHRFELEVVAEPRLGVPAAELGQPALPTTARGHVAHGQHMAWRRRRRPAPFAPRPRRAAARRPDGGTSALRRAPRAARAPACQASSSCRSSGGQNGNGCPTPTSSARSNPSSSHRRRLTERTRPSWTSSSPSGIAERSSRAPRREASASAPPRADGERGRAGERARSQPSSRRTARLATGQTASDR